MRKRPYLAMALLISLGSALALAGCAAKPPKAAETKAMITASPDVNPDSTGRPSPVTRSAPKTGSRGPWPGVGWTSP